MSKNNECVLIEDHRDERREEHSPEASGWDGIDRRKTPHRYEVLEMIREELEERNELLMARLDKLAENQVEIKAKIQQWETGAAIVRWLAISTVGVVSALMAAVDWIKDHVR